MMMISLLMFGILFKSCCAAAAAAVLCSSVHFAAAKLVAAELEFVASLLKLL